MKFLKAFYRAVETAGHVLVELKSINKELRKIMPSLQERFDTLNASLDEAASEILAELQKLREGGNLNAEQEASLAKVEEKVTALKDVSPPISPP